MNVVVVESPAKAKTINKYLGSDYKVLASYGHVRDLPAKDGSVRPDEDFDMSWEVDGKAAKRLSEIAEAAKGADRLILATDPTGGRGHQLAVWGLKKKALKTSRAAGGVKRHHQVGRGGPGASPRRRMGWSSYMSRRRWTYGGLHLSSGVCAIYTGALGRGVQSVSLQAVVEPRIGSRSSHRNNGRWRRGLRRREPFTGRLAKMEPRLTK